MFKLHSIAAGLCVGAFSALAFAGPVCTDHPRAERITPAQLLQKLQDEGYDVRSFEITDRNCYEIEGRDPKGRRVEIHFDTKTATPVRTEYEGRPLSLLRVDPAV